MGALGCSCTALWQIGLSQVADVICKTARDSRGQGIPLNASWDVGP